MAQDIRQGLSSGLLAIGLTLTGQAVASVGDSLLGLVQTAGKYKHMLMTAERFHASTYVDLLLSGVIFSWAFSPIPLRPASLMMMIAWLLVGVVFGMGYFELWVVLH